MRRGHDLVPLALLALFALGCGQKAPPGSVDPVGGTDTTRPPPPPPPPPPAPGPPPPPGMTPEAITREVRLELETIVILFDYNEDVIKPEDRPKLDRKAEIMKANPAMRIRISGHADDRGSDEYNLVLGNKRALAAKRYLESRGVDGSRIEVTSFGEERPANSGSSEAAWAQNRRDEFEIIAGGDRLVRPR